LRSRRWPAHDPSASDPVLVLIRNATLASGDYTMMTLTAATSLVVSSGSSLGTTNSAAFRLWLVGFNDAGTFRLGVINALAGVNAQPMLTPDTAGILDRGRRRRQCRQRAGVLYRHGGRLETVCGARLCRLSVGACAAGTWSASPTTLQLYHSGVPLPGRNFSARRCAIQPFTLINGTHRAVGCRQRADDRDQDAGRQRSVRRPIRSMCWCATPRPTGDFT
jgi:hypothetical protein